MLQKAPRLPLLKATERLSNGVIAERSEATVLLMLTVSNKRNSQLQGKGMAQVNQLWGLLEGY